MIKIGCSLISARRAAFANSEDHAAPQPHAGLLGEGQPQRQGENRSPKFSQPV